MNLITARYRKRYMNIRRKASDRVSDIKFYNPHTSKIDMVSAWFINDNNFDQKHNNHNNLLVPMDEDDEEDLRNMLSEAIYNKLQADLENSDDDENPINIKTFNGLDELINELSGKSDISNNTNSKSDADLDYEDILDYSIYINTPDRSNINKLLGISFDKNIHDDKTILGFKRDVDLEYHSSAKKRRDIKILNHEYGEGLYCPMCHMTYTDSGDILLMNSVGLGSSVLYDIRGGADMTKKYDMSVFNYVNLVPICPNCYCSHVEELVKENISEQYPTTYLLGIDPSKRIIPLVPACLKDIYDNTDHNILNDFIPGLFWPTNNIDSICKNYHKEAKTSKKKKGDK